MTSPARPQDWWTRPARVLPIVGTIILMVALLTPQRSEGRFGDQRLSSELSGTMGARVLADLAVRLGFTVRKDSLPDIVPHGGRAIHAVLAPPVPMSREEAHELRQAVRGGDGLLLVLDERDPLSDSLGVTHQADGGIFTADAATVATCDSAATLDLAPTLWPDARVHVFPLRWLRGVPGDHIGFARVFVERSDRSRVGISMRDAGYTAAGFPLGRGRVVVVADPDFLRNDVLRRCRWGTDVVTVRMLEWLRAGGDVPRSTIAFDEYRQGFGKHTSTGDVIMPFLGDHPVGRSILALIVAALALIVAVAPRPLVPPEVERIERRDPLEQVDALAHAYEQVRATRTVVARLLHGMRWRVQRVGVTRSASDAAFLDLAVQHHNSIADDVDVIRHALDTPVSERELLAVGAALSRVEQTLTRTPP